MLPLIRALHGEDFTALMLRKGRRISPEIRSGSSSTCSLSGYSAAVRCLFWLVCLFVVLSRITGVIGLRFAQSVETARVHPTTFEQCNVVAFLGLGHPFIDLAF